MSESIRKGFVPSYLEGMKEEDQDIELQQQLQASRELPETRAFTRLEQPLSPEHARVPKLTLLADIHKKEQGALIANTNPAA